MPTPSPDPTTGSTPTTPTPTTAGSAPPPPPTVKVQVDGREMVVTQDELIKGYQLEATARRRLQEAADQRHSLEADVTLASALRNIMATNDPSAYRQVFAGLGIPASDIDNLMANLQGPTKGGGGSDDGGETGEGGGSRTPSAPDPITVERLDPQFRQLIEQLVDTAAEYRQGRLVETGDKIVETARISVDKDPILGKIEGGKRRDRVKRFVENEVQRRVGLLKEPWPDVLQGILADARETFEEFTRNPDDAAAGQASAIGPAGSMGVRSLPKEPIKRVSVTDPHYGTNVAMRLMQKLQRKP